MKELVEFVARSVVDDPESVRVSETDGEKTIVLELRVAEGDMGKVIGKEGRVAEAVRTLLKVAAARQGKRVVLQIV
ncbi:MAG: KH domain-containing protein [Dehalococcoidia bacterium]|nr:KH domain-containing protein [Dehalococcoidia bacterium]